MDSSVGLLIVVGAVALLVLFAMGGAPASVTSSAQGLLVRPRGAAKLLALKRQVLIPWRAVNDVRVERGVKAPKGVRVLGTFAPGLVTAGSFWWVGHRSFWLRRRADEVLVIDADRSQGAAYDRVVVEVADPHAVVEQRARHLV